MATNTNFAVAVHAMAVLAYRGELTSSDLIASSINTNPVVVRRVMAKLVKAGLATSTAGKHGGFLLARSPKSVKLVDVLRAVDDAAVFRIHDNEANPNCPVSCTMKKRARRRAGAGGRGGRARARQDDASGHGRRSLVDTMTGSRRFSGRPSIM